MYEEASNKPDKFKDAVAIIKAYKEIIRTQKKKIVCIVYTKRYLFFIIRFKENESFVKIINDFRVRKSTMIFKVNIVKLGDKYQRMKNSLLFLSFIKSYFKTIKEICKENANEF